MTWWQWLVAGFFVAPFAKGISKLFGDQAFNCIEDGPKWIIWGASLLMLRDERAEFREHALDDLAWMLEKERHQLIFLARAYWQASSQLVRAPKRRLDARRARPMIESLGAPPSWHLKIWRTMVMVHAGQGVMREQAANRRMAWVYRVQKTGTIDGPTTVRSLGFKYGWHFTTITMPWPGRMSAMGHRPTLVAIVRDGTPAVGVIRRRLREQHGARFSIFRRR